jgi:gas vesicle protein
MSSGKVIMGVLTGLAVGALLGVLFAPDKGSVTRGKIKTKGKDYANDLQDKLDDFLTGLNDKFDRMNKGFADESTTTAQAETDPNTPKS